MDLIDDLLEKTSRTFALSIPLLPEPTRRELGLAYLLFRIADTFEDASDWRPRQQIHALRQFMALLRAPDAEHARRLGKSWAAEIPIDHEGYLELLRETPVVLDELGKLSPRARTAIVEHTVRTADGMAAFVARTEDGVLRLDGMEDLQRYCYVVAGIVGELSTELFVLGRPDLRPVEKVLRRDAPRFGEGLQLVNILKDSAFDTEEGRCYLAPEIDRAALFDRAREDLAVAARYTCTLQEAGAPRGVVAFCALPVRLAFAALDRVEADGPGAKISRERVYEIVAALHEDLDAGRPAVVPGEAVGSAG